MHSSRCEEFVRIFQKFYGCDEFGDILRVVMVSTCICNNSDRTSHSSVQTKIFDINICTVIKTIADLSDNIGR